MSMVVGVAVVVVGATVVVVGATVVVVGAAVVVVGAWVDPPGHDFFFVVDADDAAQVFQGMFPIIDAGTAQVRPVGDFAAMLKARAEANA